MAPKVRRCCAGISSAAIGNGAETAKPPPRPGQQPQGDQLFAGLHERDQQREKGDGAHADQHDGLAAEMIGDRRGDKTADADHQRRGDGKKTDVAGGQMQRLLCEHQQRAGHDQVVAVDKADKPEDADHHQVVGAERDAVELAAEHMAGRRRATER